MNTGLRAAGLTLVAVWGGFTFVNQLVQSGALTAFGVFGGLVFLACAGVLVLLLKS